MTPKTCFVIAPIGLPQSSTRQRSDSVLRFVIRPAVQESGYQAIRADELARPGIITQQIIRAIVSADLIVADLSDQNPNVFYELALCHWLRKPLVQLIEEGQSVPFDVAGMRTIIFNHNDLESADEARRSIIEQVRSLEADKDIIVTPTSFLQGPASGEGVREKRRWRRGVVMALVLLFLATLGSGAVIVRRMEAALERARAEASQTQKLMETRLRENEELITLVIGCQERERATGSPHVVIWTTLDCVEKLPRIP